jgi:hypothetical protein
MMNFTKWAAASAVIAIFGACTTEVTTDNPDGGTTATTAGSAGSGGSGGSGTGGSGDDGGTCQAGANPSACEKCAFDHCMTETCACDAKSTCKDARGAYFTCLAGLDGGDMESCAAAFVVAAAANASQADDLATCMGDACQDICQGKDGGPRPRR